MNLDDLKVAIASATGLGNWMVEIDLVLTNQRELQVILQSLMLLSPSRVVRSKLFGLASKELKQIKRLDNEKRSSLVTRKT